MTPQFDHDCAGDTLIGVIQGAVGIYKMCTTGYIVRYGSEQSHYHSSRYWSLADALQEAALIIGNR